MDNECLTEFMDTSVNKSVVNLISIWETNRWLILVGCGGQLGRN